MKAYQVRAWVLLAALGLCAVPSSFAQVVEPISGQDYLTDAAGTPCEGVATVTIFHCAVASGGSPLWSDRQLTIADQDLINIDLEPKHPFELCHAVQCSPWPEQRAIWDAGSATAARGGLPWNSVPVFWRSGARQY